jgi:hypothetical protein
MAELGADGRLAPLNVQHIPMVVTIASVLESFAPQG